MAKTRKYIKDEDVRHILAMPMDGGLAQKIVVEVRRCEYCSNSAEYLNGRWCKVLLIMVQNSDYCSYWEKKMAKKYIDADEFWNRLISVCEGTWTDLDTVYDLLSRMSTIDNEIINDAHNEGYDVGYLAGRRDYEPKWIPCSERLPEERGIYLVSGKWANEDGEVWICEFVRLCYIWGWCNEASRPVIQAWMPLPAAYKGGEEE